MNLELILQDLSKAPSHMLVVGAVVFGLSLAILFSLIKKLVSKRRPPVVAGIPLIGGAMAFIKEVRTGRMGGIGCASGLCDTFLGGRSRRSIRLPSKRLILSCTAAKCENVPHVFALRHSRGTRAHVPAPLRRSSTTSPPSSSRSAEALQPDDPRL